MKVQKENGKFYGWINAILLFVIYFCTTGIVVYGFAAIFPAMIDALGWGRGQASIAHTINVLAMGFLAPVMAISINKFGAKKTIMTGLTIIAFALILLGTITRQLWLWIVLWGLIIPLGIALGGLFSIQTILMHWFSAKRAMVLGLVMTAAPLAGFLAQPTLTWLILKTGSWRFGWLSACGFVIVGIILMFFVVNKPEDLNQSVDGIDLAQGDTLTDNPVKAARTFHTSRVWTYREILRTPSFWFITVLSAVHMMPLVMLLAHGVLHVTDVGYTKMQAASVISMMLLGSSIARFPSGWLADRVEPRWISVVAYMAMLVGYFFIWKAPNLPILMVMSFIFGLTYGTILVMMPTLYGNYFGPENYASIMGLVFPLTTVLGAFIPAGAGYVQEKFGSYDMAFILILMVLVIGLISSALAKPSERS
ncbi:MAG: MFS transporter [Deltaproteobacteria bacterium]|nr:MFS transporter [Deltaproteobacteria bacterium]